MLQPALVNDPFGDPGLFVDFLFERRALLFDLGDIRALPPCKLLRISDIFVSHCHMDHFMGFDWFLRICLGRDRGVRLYGPPGFLDQVEAKLAAYTWNLVHRYENDFALSVTEVAEDGCARRARFHVHHAFQREAEERIQIDADVLLDEAGFRVRYAVLDHGTPCLAFAVEETLSSFLATRYASNLPLSLSASLAFEQTYGMVEGDSASMAELCALLSAIADVPINQSRAITGSVDQFGRMQAIGAVNEKIEGFFDICLARGLSGEQGVLIPRDNRKHLMLRADVVAACAEGKFHIWAVSDVDEAIELLTGLPAGAPDEEGAVPAGSMNYLVASRLLELSALRQMYRGKPAPPRHPRKKKK